MGKGFNDENFPQLLCLVRIIAEVLCLSFLSHGFFIESHLISMGYLTTHPTVEV